jgi:hypothetical protein
MAQVPSYHGKFSRTHRMPRRLHWCSIQYFTVTIQIALTNIAVESTKCLVIFGSVNNVKRIQVHWPGGFSTGCSTPLWEIRMSGGDFMCLFVPEVKKNDIGWTGWSVVAMQSA